MSGPVRLTAWRRPLSLWHALRQARIGVKLVALTAVLTGLAVSGVFLALSFEIRASARRLLLEELARNQRTLVTLQQRTLTQLLWTSSLLTQSPTLRAALETYRTERSTGGAVRPELYGTIQHELNKVAADLDKDLLVVTDDRGRVLAASGRRGAQPPLGEDLSTLPAVRHALDAFAPIDRSSFGVAQVRGEYFQLAGVPIDLQGFTIGTLILGERLTETVVQSVREVFDGEVVVAGAAGVLTSTVSPGTDLTALLEAARRGSGLPDGTVSLGADRYVVAPLTLGVGPARQPVVLFLLHSVTAATTRVNRALLLHFLLYGTVAVTLAALGAAAASRSVLAPFGAFVRFMRSVAASGRFSLRFDASGATREIRSLNETYDRLIDSLAREQAQLEQRTRELALANDVLTQEIQDREQAQQALRSSEAQLRQAQKMEAVGTLAGGVAHDFNNLLTVISSYTELAMDELGAGHPVHGDLGQAKQAAHRAALLTQQLLAFSRKQVLQPKVLDLNAVVGNIEKMLARLIGEHIELRTVKRTPLTRVKADPGQIEQVLMNLAVNARDAMPQGGRLTIETANVQLDQRTAGDFGLTRPGPGVVLAVRDTGVGMDEATRARVFEPFFTTKEPGKGTGLGLSTVYGIVQQSGGGIAIETEPGRGTTFRIFLPRVDEVEEAPAAATGATPGAGAETVLVVEDEEPVLVLACRCLERAGYRVLSAASGDQALRIAARHPGPIHLLLTDVVMPRLSGKELAARLLADRPGLRVLYMSGYTDEAIVHHGVLEAGVELLQKPFTPESLALRVRQALDRAPLRHATAG